MDYSALTRKQLQAEAKKRGVKANGKSVDIIEALKQLDGPCDAPPIARDVRPSDIMEAMPQIQGLG